MKIRVATVTAGAALAAASMLTAMVPAMAESTSPPVIQGQMSAAMLNEGIILIPGKVPYADAPGGELQHGTVANLSMTGGAVKPKPASKPLLAPDGSLWRAVQVGSDSFSGPRFGYIKDADVVSAQALTEIAAAEEAAGKAAATKSEVFSSQFTGKGTIKTNAQWWPGEGAAGEALGISGSPAVQAWMSEPYEAGGQTWRKIIAPTAFNMAAQTVAYVLDADVEGFVADAEPAETAAPLESAPAAAAPAEGEVKGVMASAGSSQASPDNVPLGVLLGIGAVVAAGGAAVSLRKVAADKRQQAIEATDPD